MKFTELPDEIQMDLTELGYTYDSNAQVPMELAEGLAIEYPDLMVPQQEMDPVTGEMVDTFGKKLTQTTPLSTEREMPEKVKPIKGDDSQLFAWADKASKSQPGIFRYVARGKWDETGTKGRVNWTRAEKYSPQELKQLEAAFKRKDPEGFQGLDLILDPEASPGKVLTYLEGKGLLDPNASPEQKAATARDYAGQPQLYRALALGEDPGSLKNLAIRGGQIIGMPLREIGAKAAPGDQGTPDELYKEMARPGAKPGSGFWSSMAQETLKSPVAPLSLAAGAAIPFGGGTALSSLGKQMLFGAGEAGLEMAAQEGMGAASYTPADYLTGMGFGSALGGAFAAPGAAGQLARRAREVGASDNALKRAMRDLMPRETAARAQAKQETKQLARDQFDMGTVDWYADEWGVAPDQIFPAIGAKNRKSPVIRDLKAISREYPEVMERWENTWDMLSNSIDAGPQGPRTNFKSAPTPAQAGATLKQAMLDAEGQMFDGLDMTYSGLQQDQNLARNIDRALSDKAGNKLYDEITNMSSELMDNFPKVEKMTKQGEMVKVPAQIDKGQFNSAKRVNEMLNDVRLVLEKYDTAEARPGSGRVFSDLEKVRKLLSQTLKNQKDPNLDPQYKLPDVAEKYVAKAYKAVRENIADAVDEVDPQVAEALRASNEKQQAFFELRKKVQPALKQEQDISAFNGIWNDPAKAKALKNALAMYGQVDAFNKGRDAWFSDKVLNLGSSGNIGDKWKKNLVKAQNADYVKDFYNADIYDDLLTISDTMFNLGDPSTHSQIGGALEGTASSAIRLSDLKNPFKLTGKMMDRVAGRTREIPKNIQDKYELVNITWNDALNNRLGINRNRQYEGPVGPMKQAALRTLATNPFGVALDSPDQEWRSTR